MATRGKRIPPEVRDQIVQDYRDGVPTVQIAERYDVSPATVSNTASRAGLPRRPLGRPPLDDTERPDPHALTGGDWVTDDRGIRRWVRD